MADENSILGVSASINGQDIEKGAREFINKLNDMERAADKAANAMADAFGFLDKRLSELATTVEKNRGALSSIFEAISKTKADPASNKTVIGAAEKEYKKAEDAQKSAEAQLNSTRESIIQQRKAYEESAGMASVAGNAGVSAARNVSGAVEGAKNQVEALTNISKNQLRKELKSLEEQSAQIQLRLNTRGNDIDRLNASIETKSAQVSFLSANQTSENNAVNLQIAQIELDKLIAKRDKLIEKDIQEGDELEKINERIAEINRSLDPGNKVASFRAQITKLSNDIMRMEEANQADTDEYRQKHEQLVKMRTEQHKFMTQMRAESTPGTGMAAFRESITGISGGMGVMSLFNQENEELIKIQTRLQSVMSITMDIQQLMSLSYETSTLRIWLMIKAQQAATASSLSLAGVWSLMLGGAAIAIAALVVAWKKVSDALELNHAKAKAMSDIYKKANDDISKNLSTLDQLTRKYNQLGNAMADKNKFIRDNQEAFNQLGISITSVSQAEDLFASPEKLQQFQEAIKARARATAAMEIASDAYKKQLDMEVKKELEIQEKRSQIGKYMNLGTGSAVGASITGSVQRSTSLYSQESFEKDRADIEKKYAGKHEIQVLQRTIDAAIGMNSQYDKQATDALRSLGLQSTNDKKFSDSMTDFLALLDKNKREQIRKEEDAIIEVNEAEINALAEGAEKTLRARKLAHEKELREIRREAEDMKLAFVERAKSEFEANPNNLGKFSASSFTSTQAYKDYANAVDARAQQRTAASNRSYLMASDLISGMDAYKTKMQEREEEQKRFNDNIAVMESLLKDAESAQEGVDEKVINGLREKIRLARIYKDLSVYDKGEAEFLKGSNDFQERLRGTNMDFQNQYDKATASGDIFGAMNIRRAWMNELSEISTEDFKNSVNWEAVFGNIDILSEEQLRTIREQLREALSSDNISIDGYKEISERIDEIGQKLQERRHIVAELFGVAVPELEQINRLEQEALDARQQAETQEQKLLELKLRQLSIQERIRELARESGVEVRGPITSENISSILSGNIQSPEMMKALGDLAEMENAISRQSDVTQKATSNSAMFTSALSNATSGAQGMASSFGMVDFIFHKINENVQSLPGLIEEIGVSADSKLTKGINDFAESSAYATNGFDAMKSGDFVGAVSNTLGAFRKLGDSLGSLGIGMFGESDNTLEKDIERLTLSNESLRFSIESLAERIEESYGADAMAVYAQQQSEIRNAMENTAEMMRRSAASYSNGFLGIGGDRSTNYEINRVLGVDEWMRVSEIAGTSIRNAEEFFALSSRQMYDIATNAPDIWTMILSAQGHNDVSGFMSEYIGYWRQLEESSEKVNDQLTATTFDNVESSYLDMLRDMESDTQTASDNISKTFFDALLSNNVWAKMKDRLADWYKTFGEYMSDGSLSDDEMIYLRNEYERLTKEGIERRDELARVTGYRESQFGQEATSRGFQTMSEDQADELNGRFTSLQISGEQIKADTGELVEVSNLIHDDTSAIRQSVAQQQADISEIADIQRESVTYLSQIAKNTNQLYQMNERLGRIEENTKKL